MEPQNEMKFHEVSIIALLQLVLIFFHRSFRLEPIPKSEIRFRFFSGPLIIPGNLAPPPILPIREESIISHFEDLIVKDHPILKGIH